MCTAGWSILMVQDSHLPLFHVLFCNKCQKSTSDKFPTIDPGFRLLHTRCRQAKGRLLLPIKPDVNRASAEFVPSHELNRYVTMRLSDILRWCLICFSLFVMRMCPCTLGHMCIPTCSRHTNEQISRDLSLSSWHHLPSLPCMLMFLKSHLWTVCCKREETHNAPANSQNYSAYTQWLYVTAYVRRQPQPHAAQCK